MESGYIAGPAGIENVDNVSMLRDGDWLASAAGSFANKSQRRACDLEYGDLAATGIDRKKEGIVLRESKRSLRAEGIGNASATSSAGGEEVATG